jgi:hypothetical protein
VDRTHLSYLDFELEIDLGRGREYPVAVVRSPAGEARDTMRFPFDELALESRLKDLQIALLRSGGVRRQVLSPEEQTVQDFGKDLFNALFAGEVRHRYDVSLERAWQEGKGIRLKLRIQPPELAALPWEFMYDPRQAEYVCLSRDTPVVRYLELPRRIQPLVVTTPLRILGMIASPHDLPSLDMVREKERVERAIQDLQTHGLVELAWLEGPTWRTLQREMRGGPWHVFHFIGHGGFDRNADEGFIALADEEGETRRLSATQLGRLLADHRFLRLALLNACEGARGGKRDIFSSTASILVRRGIPAVLAMQYEITDRAAIEVARAFYEAVAEGMSVDAAVVEARKAISLAVPNTVEWGTPVLYMRSTDGVLFDIHQQRSRVRQQLETPVIRFPSGEQAVAVTEWVVLAERNWAEATELLYNGSLEKWLTQISQPDLAYQAWRIRQQVTDDHAVGLEQFQRIAGPFEPQRKTDVVTNLNDLVGQLTYWKLRKQKAPEKLILEITNQSRGYMHGIVISKVNWIDVPRPRFGCLPRQTVKVDIVVDPAKRRTWAFAILPLDFALE